ncbi:hypothetical protein M413DRAFT_447038 [Hebeloma cylindrosporum]|uniref:N-acetyltransferase domain-containing protein n=1 Tax=Hebeloma cylindrosporum TaxID=76867 RepID=A0A0C3C5M0_HEBCY|nr:hypothetical protein M413DRAFT_447038 [Hebeloma cylindrosporum h7]
MSHSQQQIEIWTERLLLRGAQESDLEAFCAWFRDPQAMQFWSTAPHTTTAQTKKFLDSMIASPYNGVLDFTVCLNSDGASSSSDSEEGNLIVIGKAGLWDGEEIGFIFNRDYWRKGYAFEALDAIIRHLWDNHLDVGVVKADVDPRNRASLNLLRRLGFVVVGEAKSTFETHIGWCDSVYLEARRPVSVE